MQKVIDLLEKELERQGLLRMANKDDKKRRGEMNIFGIEYKGPPAFPEEHLFEDEIKKAIEILKAR